MRPTWNPDCGALPLPHEAAPRNPGLLPAKAFGKANPDPDERSQASPAPLSQVGWSWGSLSDLPPLSSPTAALPARTAVIPSTHTHHFTTVHVHAHSQIHRRTLHFGGALLPSGRRPPADRDSRTANSLELPGL